MLLTPRVFPGSHVAWSARTGREPGNGGLIVQVRRQFVGVGRVPAVATVTSDPSSRSNIGLDLCAAHAVDGDRAGATGADGALASCG
jgi:hypothetical protein